MDGIETMMEIRRIHKDAPVVIVTAYATVDTAITAIKEGALEYIVKPCNPQEISLLVERIIKVKNLQRENAILRQQLQRNYQYRDIITKNPKMQRDSAAHGGYRGPAQHGADSRRERHGQGIGGARHSLSPAIARPSRSSRSTSPRSRRRCWKSSCSATKRARSPARRRRRVASSKWRTGARFSGRDRRHPGQAAGRTSARAPGALLIPRWAAHKRLASTCG